jgi:N-acyl-phosphatidylethanolamine-hydrolysing phospholipase D
MHVELGAKRTVGVHYATWILSDEHYLAPQRELSVAVREASVEAEVMAGQMGRTMVIPWGGGESSDEESSAGISESEEVKGGNLVEGRGGKCIVWR